MIQYHVYPGGKKHIVTFSYDDGPANDKRLTELFNKYNVKATFHLNSKRYLGKTEEELDEIRAMYRGHEISCHTVQHGSMPRMPMPTMVTEVMEDRKNLEHLAGYPVTGMSYPYGHYNKEVLQVLEACGIVYSRTVKNTRSFELPADFLEWHPTCHHVEALSLCDKFLADLEEKWTHPLFYIWGHSFEFRTEEDWEKMEEILKKLSGNDRIWYATNMEIYEYVTAQKRLVISADEKIIFNPSAIPVWVEKNKTDIVMIPAGETVYL